MFSSMPFRPGLLHQLGILDPAGVGDAVQAADDRDVHRRRRLPQQLQVVIRADGVIVHLREVVQRLGETLGAGGHQVFQRGAFVLQLLLEQREQDHGRRAGVFQALDVGHAPRQRRGRRHDGMLQLHPHVTSC